MPANEFEKKVQQQLDEFQLNASASVWTNVEKEIRKRKQRRILFFFLFPTLLVSGFFIYFLTNNNNNNSLSAPQSANNNHLQQKTSSTIDTAMTNDKKEWPVARSIKSDRSSAGANKISAENNSLEINLTTAASQRHGNRQFVNPMKTKSPNDVKPGKAAELLVTVDKPVATIAPVAGIENSRKQDTKISSIQVDTNHVRNVAVTSTDSEKKGTVTNRDSLLATTNSTENSSSGPDGKQEKHTRLHWGIDLNAGISSGHSEVFSMLSASRDAIAQVPSASTGFPGATQPMPPSSIKAGLAFKIGAVIEWKISPRSSISSGLNYRYASTEIKVGTARDTSLAVTASSSGSYNSLQVDKVYSGNRVNNYTNNYHFVSVPVEYHWMINKKIPVQWDAGLSLDHLFATNGLVYSQSFGGVYYENDDAFNKTHFMVNTGVSYRAKTKKGMEWMIGPQIAFDTRTLLNNANNKQYLLFTTVNARLLFSKKKK